MQAKTTANDICIGSHVFVQNQEDVEKVADVLVKDTALTVVIMFINVSDNTSCGVLCFHFINH